eukprot:4151822-Pleurochrysis_carterae.AAC.1
MRKVIALKASRKRSPFDSQLLQGERRKDTGDAAADDANRLICVVLKRFCLGLWVQPRPEDCFSRQQNPNSETVPSSRCKLGCNLAPSVAHRLQGEVKRSWQKATPRAKNWALDTCARELSQGQFMVGFHARATSRPVFV